MCSDFAQLGQFAQISNSVFRAIRAATPGPYTFILPATGEVPRRLLHPKKRTVGVRIPDHAVCQALLTELGEPLVTSTLILPGETEPRALGWEIKEELDHASSTSWSRRARRWPSRPRSWTGRRAIPRSSGAAPATRRAFEE